MTNKVISETDGVGVVTIAIDNPPANRLDPDILGELREALLAADSSPTTSAIVLRGRGESFCGGLDADWLAAGGNPVELGSGLIELLRVPPILGVPLLAAVSGDALASGFSLVCSADIAVAVRGAKLGTMESSVGLWPTIAQVPVAQRLLPRHALQNVITGDPFSAEEALAVGAVNEVVDDEGALDASIGRWIAAATRSGALGRPGRRAFYRMLGRDWDGALDEAAAMLASTVAGGQAR